MKILISVISIVGFLLCALVTDCTCAKPQWQNAMVSGRWIKPAWTEMQVTQTGKQTTIVPIYHSEEYFVTVTTSGGTGNVMVTAWDYGQWNEGKECQVEYRTGKIMTYGYLSLR